jgi:uncharacterized protein YbaR (Trm112 family)
MPAQPRLPSSLAPAEIDQLACPACFAGLRPDESDLVCQECGRRYPVVDGIPVLIVERASVPAR